MKSAAKGRELFRHHLELVGRIARTYSEFSNLPAICAGNPNPNPISRSHRWSAQTAHWLIDVERVVKGIVIAQPDAEALKESWDNLEDRQPTVVTEVDRRLVNLLGPVMDAMELDPITYLKADRYPQRRQHA